MRSKSYILGCNYFIFGSFLIGFGLKHLRNVDYFTPEGLVKTIIFTPVYSLIHTWKLLIWPGVN